eukprot:SM000020S06112  [mRNA]  locus=s20:1039476:1039885:- [translate_table: standard]
MMHWHIRDFSYNNLTAYFFPDQLLKCRNLQVLNIAGNQFEGVLPDLGLGIKPFAYLTKLQKL